MIKLPFTQKCCGLLGSNVFKQHTAVADGQDNVVAHIRAAGFADQNRTVVFAVQTQYAPQSERLVAGDAAQFDMFGQIGRAAVERIAISAAEYGGFQPEPEHPLRSPAALVGRTEGYDASGDFFGMASISAKGFITQECMCSPCNKMIFDMKTSCIFAASIMP